MMSEDFDLVQEAKQRLADRYTSAELMDILDIPVEELIDEYWHLLVQKLEELLD